MILCIYDVKVNVNCVKDEDISFFITTDPKPHKCPRCSNQTAKVHDYRIQKIKDIPFQGKSCTLHLKKRRYHCPNCGKHFYESYDFVSKYMHRTQRLTKFIAHSFSSAITITEASDKANVSTHTVYKILGTLNNSSDRIGESISIDEFKGNAGTEKYQTIVVDPIKRKVLDILYSRKNVQKSMSNTLRRYYKRSRHIITARKSNLSEENKAALNLMLEYSEDLRKAHFIKELFIELLDEKSYSKQRVLLREWLLEVESSGIKEFNAAITAFRNNYKYILNSLKYRHISNGPTEGFNNKIKVLKGISYGVRNFTYFRNRILIATA